MWQLQNLCQNFVEKFLFWKLTVFVQNKNVITTPISSATMCNEFLSWAKDYGLSESTITKLTTSGLNPWKRWSYYVSRTLYCYNLTLWDKTAYWNKQYLICVNKHPYLIIQIQLHIWQICYRNVNCLMLDMTLLHNRTRTTIFIYGLKQQVRHSAL